ncbi:MAG: glycosyltransferase [Microthrixaceae bacterium]
MNGPIQTPVPSVAGIAASLESFVTDTLGDLVTNHLPNWRVPGFFAGHPVEPDVAADLVFVLAHLGDLGVVELDGTPLDTVIASVLAHIDGARTHTFFSYRVAETLARYGPLHDNRLLRGWSNDAVANLATAVDSTDWVELLDLGLPRNYSAVLARCELARHNLGLDIDENLLGDLLERARSMLGRDPTRFLDDSTHGVGRVDIYTVDVWLFTEPLARLLGDLWDEGTANAVELLELTGTPKGAAVAWGRSTGALACALTIEMAALVLAADAQGRRFTDAPHCWHTRLAEATAEMPGWFDGGLTTAHRNRNPYAYRGPFRRLQMTLDLLGKLAWSAHRLRSVTSEPAPGRDSISSRPADGLIHLATGSNAAVWTDHDPGAELDEPTRNDHAVVIPFVGATRSDYLAAPRRPGLYEVPVDSDIACWVPVIAARQHRFAPSGLPDGLEASREGVIGQWSRLDRIGDLDPERDVDHLSANARIEYQREARTTEVSIEISLDTGELTDAKPAVPDAIAVNIPETLDRPLRVELVDAQPSAQIGIVDTAGVDEWRSFWAELPVLHQIDVVEPGPHTALRYRVTPTLRVASSAHSAHYDDCLYGPLEADRRALSLRNPLGPLGVSGAALDRALERIDLYHLHWPEWLAFDDPAAHAAAIQALARHRIPVVWTAHNLTPHDKNPEVYDGIYQRWAEHVDAVIHHSAFARDLMTRRYRFGAHTTHHVIPHGHFGGLYPSAQTPRDLAEERLGLSPSRLRVGILGAPRIERDVSGFLDAVYRSANPEVRVCCWSLGTDDPVPDDPRIEVAETYEMVDAETYGLRLAACDVLALPFDPDGDMLATGVAADAIGCGKATLVSPWGYLAETLGDAGIPMGDTVESMTGALDHLDRDAVDTAAAAAVGLRAVNTWKHSAELTMDVFESVLG